MHSAAGDGERWSHWHVTHPRPLLAVDVLLAKLVGVLGGLLVHDESTLADRHEGYLSRSNETVLHIHSNLVQIFLGFDPV